MYIGHSFKSATLIYSREFVFSDLGSAMCPWQLQSQPGLRYNITLWNFARTSGTSVDDGLARRCYKVGKVHQIQRLNAQFYIYTKQRLTRRYKDR